MLGLVVVCYTGALSVAILVMVICHPDFEYRYDNGYYSCIGHFILDKNPNNRWVCSASPRLWDHDPCLTCCQVSSVCLSYSSRSGDVVTSLFSRRIVMTSTKFLLSMFDLLPRPACLMMGGCFNGCRQSVLHITRHVTCLFNFYRN